MIIELSIPVDERHDDLVVLIRQMAAFLGAEVKIRQVIQVKTDSEELAKTIKTMIPGKVAQIILGKLAEGTQLTVGLAELAQDHNQKKHVGKFAPKRCAGCGEIFAPYKNNDYRCKKCSSINFSQRKSCYTVEDPSWPECLMSKKLLTKKLSAREMTPGATVLLPSGKVFNVIAKNDGEQILKAVELRNGAEHGN